MSVASLIEVKPNPNIPALAPGDTAKVSAKIVEGEGSMEEYLRTQGVNRQQKMISGQIMIPSLQRRRYASG